MRPALPGRTLRRRDEAGYAALLVALFASTVFLGLAALGVDTARWYVEMQRLQKAADAAALAGVTYMPADLASARTTARAAAAKNGYTAGGDTTVTVAQGARPSQLRVTISTVVDNAFGSMIGVPTARVTRTAVADFTAPAPMGSPCNIFGNEPPSTPTTAQPTGTALPSPPFSNCSSNPQFWAAIEGPATDKVQGDRYMTNPCVTVGRAGATYACDSGTNREVRPEGYFWSVHVEPEAVGTPIDVQIYDPAFTFTSVDCSMLRLPNNPETTSDDNLNLAGNAANNMNIYVPSDAVARYDDISSTYCSGDYVPGAVTGPPPDTTFLLREQTDTGDPMRAPIVNPSACVKQFRGSSATPQAVSSSTSIPSMRRYNPSTTTNNRYYNPEVARVFHQWVSLCTFTPTREGDWYIQVRTNVSLGGSAVTNTNAYGQSFSPVVYTGNPAAGNATGNASNTIGLNSFALRAVPTNSAMRSKVAVAGFYRMPILQNAGGSTARFNLIRALPQTAGQHVMFDFYDAADGVPSTQSGTVRVLAPPDATGSIRATTNIPGCRGARNTESTYTSLTNCTVTVRNSSHDGQLQHMVIPIPSDYNCDPATLGGCWFQVEITFPGNVTDFTTWDASIGGDPVRLIE